MAERGPVRPDRILSLRRAAYRSACRYAPLLELRKLSAARDVVCIVIKPTIWRDSRARVGAGRASFSPANRGTGSFAANGGTPYEP
jgi:hypothetical protein